MLQYKIIRKEQYAQLNTPESMAAGHFESLLAAKHNLTEELSLCQDRINCLRDQQQSLSKQNIQLSQNLVAVDQNCLRTHQENQHLKQQLRQQNSEKQQLAKRLMSAQTKYKRKEEENCKILRKIEQLQKGLIIQNEKMDQYEENITKLDETVSQLSENLRLEKDRNHDKSKRLQQKQNEIQFLTKRILTIQKENRKLENNLNSQKRKLQQLTKSLQEYQRTPNPRMQEQLNSKIKWIEQLTAELNQVKQKCVNLEMDRISKAGLTNEHSVTPVMKPMTAEQLQRAKYIALCKKIANEFNLKFKKVHTQKKKTEDKYKSVKQKLHNCQRNECKLKDRQCLYMEKILRYERLTQKQQQQMEKILNEFDLQINQIIKMKQGEILAKLQHKIQSSYQHQQQSQQSLLKSSRHNSDFSMKQSQSQQNNLILQEQSIDTIEMQLLKQQVQKLTEQLSKYKKKNMAKKDLNQKLQSEIQCLSQELRSLKEFNFEIVKQLELKTNQIDILKNLLNLHASNVSHEDVLQTLSRIQIQTQDKQSSFFGGDNPYEYQISEIDTELDRRNQSLLSMIKKSKMFMGFANQATGPQSPLNKLLQQNNQFKKKSSSNNSFSSYNLSSSRISDESSPNSSFSSKNSNNYRNREINNKSFYLKNNSTVSGIKSSHGISDGQLSGFRMHKNSLC